METLMKITFPTSETREDKISLKDQRVSYLNDLQSQNDIFLTKNLLANSIVYALLYTSFVGNKKTTTNFYTTIVVI